MHTHKKTGSIPFFFKTPYVTQTSGLCEDTFSRLNKEEIEMRSWKVNAQALNDSYCNYFYFYIYYQIVVAFPNEKWGGVKHKLFLLTFIYLVINYIYQIDIDYHNI